MLLDEKIKTKIAESVNILEQLPGVVIVHRIEPFSVVYMNRSGLQRLNTTLAELQTMGNEYHQRYFNPEDAHIYVPIIFGLLERNNNDETVSCFQQVRAHEGEEWQWYATGNKIFMHDDAGKPLLTISVATPIDTQHYFASKIERLLAENLLLKKNQHLYAKLGSREKQVLGMMAKGKSSRDIADELFLSEDTVKTHRRNIKRKTGAQNQYEITLLAQAFDLV